MAAEFRSFSALAAEGHQETTLLFLPHSQPRHDCHKTASKRSLFSSRQQPDPEEEPLSFSFDDPPSDSSDSFSQPAPPTLHPFASNSTPPPTTLPVCYTTTNSCIAATSNCSSHGTCTLKYRTEDGSTCYACTCGSTVVRTNEDGSVKTVQWGGAACQKKDVSVPFFLFASIGIGLTMAAAWGVGLLFSIGEEDLPSVIGAGVAGPRAQR